MSCTLGLVQEGRSEKRLQLSAHAYSAEMNEAISPSFGLAPLYFCDTYHEEQFCAAYVQ